MLTKLVNITEQKICQPNNHIRQNKYDEKLKKQIYETIGGMRSILE